ncbi:MAG: hypothetical protein ABJB16_13150 [Saprospiraceae bacterium]
MKKILILSTIFLIHMQSYAQTEKGNIFLGGQLNLFISNWTISDNNNVGTSQTLNFSIAPNIGAFIKDNLAIGLAINIGNSNNKNVYDPVSPLAFGSTIKNSTMNYGVGIFMRSYKKITNNFYFSINGQLNYLSQPGKTEDISEDPNVVYPPSSPAIQYIRSSTIGVTIAPGLDYFITPHLGLRATFGNLFFNTSTTKNITLQNDNKQTVSNYGINLNISTFSFGMNYYF